MGTAFSIYMGLMLILSAKTGGNLLIMAIGLLPVSLGAYVVLTELGVFR